MREALEKGPIACAAGWSGDSTMPGMKALQAHRLYFKDYSAQETKSVSEAR